MSQFDGREKAEEKKYVNEEEKRFLATARRNKALGLWAAEIMGMDASAAEDYAKAVNFEDLKEKGEEDVFRKVYADLQAKNADVSEHVVRRQMAELFDKALNEL